MEGPVYHVGRFCGKTHQKGLGFGLLFLYRQFIKVSGEPIYQKVISIEKIDTSKYQKRFTNIQNSKKKQDRSLSENKLEKLFFQ